MSGNVRKVKREQKKRKRKASCLLTFMHDYALQCNALLCAWDAWMTHSVYTNVGGAVNATLCVSVDVNAVVLHALAGFVMC